MSKATVKLKNFLWTTTHNQTKYLNLEKFKIKSTLNVSIHKSTISIYIYIWFFPVSKCKLAFNLMSLLANKSTSNNTFTSVTNFTCSTHHCQIQSMSWNKNKSKVPLTCWRNAIWRQADQCSLYLHPGPECATVLIETLLPGP